MISKSETNPFKGKYRTFLLILVPLVIILSTVFLLIFQKPVMVSNVINQTILRINGFESKNIKLDSYNMHYWAGGKGKPLVIVPGLYGKGADFSFLLPELAEKYQVYALDLIGFGESDKPSDVDYSIDFQSHQLLRFFESQKIEKAILVAHSFGGWVSLKFTSLWPEKVNNLVLITSGGLKFSLPIILHHLSDPKNLDELRESLNLMAIPLPPEFVQKDLLKYYQKQSSVMKLSLDTAFSKQEFLDGKLGKVKMPVLLIWGKEDRMVPIEIGEKMHKEMPQSVLMIFDHCGHSLVFQCKERVLPQLHRFLENEINPASILVFSEAANGK